MVDSEKVDELMITMEEKLEKTASVLREEFSNIRAGRANPHVLDKIQVDYYGVMTPSIRLAISPSPMRSAWSSARGMPAF